MGSAPLRKVGRTAQSVWKLSRFAKSQSSELLLSWIDHVHYRTFLAGALLRTPTAFFQKGGAFPDVAGHRRVARLPCRAALANSPYTAACQQRVFDAVGRSVPIYVVPSAVDFSQFDSTVLGTAAENRRQLGLPADRPTVVMVGRLQSWKGFHTLLRGLAIVKLEVPEVLGVMVGGTHSLEAQYAKHVQELTDSLGLRDNVVWTGAVAHDLVPRYMQAADIVVHASRNEPFGIVVIEALALGKALIAADHGGPADVVRDGKEGLLVGFEKDEAMADALIRLIQDAALRSRLGEAGKRRAQMFGVDKFARRMDQAVADIIGRKHPPGVYFEGNPSVGFDTAS
jgi:glycosyltransferase involved in cell wall biosynthesis